MLAIHEDGYVVIPPDGLAAALGFALTLFFWFLVVAVESNKQCLAIGGDPGIRLLNNRRIPGEAIKRLDTEGIPPRRVIQAAIDDRRSFSLRELNIWTGPGIRGHGGCEYSRRHSKNNHGAKSGVEESGFKHWDVCGWP